MSFGMLIEPVQIGPDENDTGLVLTLLRECTSTKAVVELLETIQGPFAFVYWQVLNHQMTTTIPQA